MLILNWWNHLHLFLVLNDTNSAKMFAVKLSVVLKLVKLRSVLVVGFRCQMLYICCKCSSTINKLEFLNFHQRCAGPQSAKVLAGKEGNLQKNTFCKTVAGIDRLILSNDKKKFLMPQKSSSWSYSSNISMTVEWNIRTSNSVMVSNKSELSTDYMTNGQRSKYHIFWTLGFSSLYTVHTPYNPYKSLHDVVDCKSFSMCPLKCT